MKTKSTLPALFLSGTLLLLLVTILTSFRPGPTKMVASAGMILDDTYYKIPDGATYNDKPITNKAGPLTLSTELGQNYYLVNDTVNDTGFLYAEINADDYIPAQKVRSPLNLALVIDRSGSMAGDKLEYAKKAAHFLIDKLDDKDMLSIITYESYVGVLQKSAPVDDKAALHAIINKIVETGSTNLSGGMEAGYMQVKSTYKPGAVNRVLLLSDGLPTAGTTNTDQLKSIAKKWFSTESISISTFGIGDDYNDVLMTGLAENGGGNYYYIKEPSQIPALFEKEADGLVTLVARQAGITFSLPPQLDILRVYGGNYEMDNNRMTVNLKDIFAKETKAILIKFKIKAGTNTELPIATNLEFDDATNNDKKIQVANLNLLKPVTDSKVYYSNFSKRVMQQCTMFESNDLLEKAMKAVDDGDYGRARDLGGYGANYLQSNTSKAGFSQELIVQDSMIIKYQYELKDVEMRSVSEKNAMQKASRSVNYKIRGKK